MASSSRRIRRSAQQSAVKSDRRAASNATAYPPLQLPAAQQKTLAKVLDDGTGLDDADLTSALTVGLKLGVSGVLRGDMEMTFRALVLPLTVQDEDDPTIVFCFAIVAGWLTGARETAAIPAAFGAAVHSAARGLLEGLCENAVDPASGAPVQLELAPTLSALNDAAGLVRADNADGDRLAGLTLSELFEHKPSDLWLSLLCLAAGVVIAHGGDPSVLDRWDLAPQSA